MPDKQVITRIAPSPTGDPHVGTLRNALYNWLFARQHGGKFILRLEDTDRQRYVEQSEAAIFDMFEWTGLDFDGEPIIQSQRQLNHAKYAKQLVESGKAYYCFCYLERLERLRKEQQARKERPRYDGRCRTAPSLTKGGQGGSSVIRLKIPEAGETIVSDIVHGEVTFQNSELDDLVLLKSDGYPTYHLAHIVDDHESGVSHVIRGDEWLPSLPKHVLIHEALGWQPPVYAHLPLILATDKSKLSKRHGSVAVTDFKKQGYLPEALLNFVLLLGWHPKKGSEQEIFTRDEILAQFKLEDVQKSGATFDYQKLDSINAIYIKNTSLDRLVELSEPFMAELGLLKKQVVGSKQQGFLKKVVALEKERIKKLSELPEAIKFIFEPIDYDPEILIWQKSDKETTVNRLTELTKLTEGIKASDWHADYLERVVKEHIAGSKLGIGDTLWPMRVALSGQQNSPGSFEIAAVLGKDETLKRIQTAIEKLAPA